jgi:ketosteroid isomerase-like protein
MIRFRHSRGFKTVLGLIGIVGLLFVTGCAPKAPADDADAQTLTQLDDAWSKDAGAKDAAKVASYYAADAVAYPPNAPLANGRDAAQKIWADYFALPDFSISWTTTHAGSSGNLGYTTGTYQDSYAGPDGKTVHETGKYVCVWKKQADGGWKAIHDTWNSDTQ